MTIPNWAILARHSIFTAIEQSDAFFRPATEVEAVDWLKQNTNYSDAVLSTYWTGSYIPARAGNIVYLGQRYETIQFEDKLDKVATFFSEFSNDADRISLIKANRIAYVFYGTRERALGSFNPMKTDYLEPVFSNSSVTIYRVRK